MTWQGAGGSGESGDQPVEPDDATRTDWPAANAPSPAGDPTPTEPTPIPAAPIPAAPIAQPPAAPSAAPAPPPASVAPVPPAGGPSPWAPPVAAQATDGWGAPPVGGGGRYAVPGAPGLIYAGAIPRAAAFIVDSFLLGIVVSIISAPFAAAAVASTTNGVPDFTQYTTRSGIGAVLAAVIDGVYFAGLWMSSGRATLGMRLFSLQVGSFADGAKLRPDQAIKRWLAYGSWLGIFAIAPVLGGALGLLQLLWTLVLLVTTATSPTKQGLHDRIAASAVVRPASAGNGLAIACLLVALVVPFLVIISLIALVFLGGQVSEILSTVGESI